MNPPPTRQKKKEQKNKTTSEEGRKKIIIRFSMGNHWSDHHRSLPLDVSLLCCDGANVKKRKEKLGKNPVNAVSGAAAHDIDQPKET